MNRRTFLQAGVLTGAALITGIGWGAAQLYAEDEKAQRQLNALSRLKSKLESGQSAVLLIISDSTGYAEDSATRRFVRWLALSYPKHTVRESLWNEWQTNKPSGPKDYAGPVTLSTGINGSSATLEVFNAALPGGVAQNMVDGARWKAMIAPLQGTAPDLILWNHGHNHQANLPLADFPNGRGSFYAPIGRVAFEFPTSPQAAIVQNPWRDNDGYQRVMEWWKAVGTGLPALTLIDGYSPFIKENKDARLYKDTVHPRAEGYELIYQQILGAWKDSSPGKDTNATTCWPKFADGDPILNEDFAAWTAMTELPRNWVLQNGASVQQSTDVTFGKAATSLSIIGTKQNGALQFKFPDAALKRMRGKTLSIAVLCYVPGDADQDMQISFMTSSSNQVTGSTQRARDNWKWVVMAGCVVSAECAFAVASIWRSFAKPCNDKPIFIHKITVVEGDCPKGML
ncbi:MAG: SGNH/GDSL hydrolase family protein [Candidatus Methylacidiphilales bacterium]|nr:SGNH/GDSL hydrolase family protein [Candidatus Methylacidiphilales bacterium]